MIAIVPVRGGVLPAGAEEAIEEASGRAWLVGRGVQQAVGALGAAVSEVRGSEVGAYRPVAWAAALAPRLADEAVIVLAASPDGRDLAPHLAAALRRPLVAQAVRITEQAVTTIAWDGRVEHEHRLDGPVVATLVPGVRGIDGRPDPGGAPPSWRPVALDVDGAAAAGAADAVLVEELPPDPATIDLAEAGRIVAGGAGLGGPEAFTVLTAVGAAWAPRSAPPAWRPTSVGRPSSARSAPPA